MGNISLGEFSMNIDKFKVFYKELLLKAGVNSQRAEEACKNLTIEEIAIICDILPKYRSVEF